MPNNAEHAIDVEIEIRPAQEPGFSVTRLTWDSPWGKLPTGSVSLPNGAMTPEVEDILFSLASAVADAMSAKRGGAASAAPPLLGGPHIIH